LQLIPQAHRGKKCVIPVEKSSLGTSFTFQRRRYIYSYDDDTFHKVRCKVDIPVPFFFRWKGFSCNAEVADAQVRTVLQGLELSLDGNVRTWAGAAEDAENLGMEFLVQGNSCWMSRRGRGLGPPRSPGAEGPVRWV
jgi:hypothetical protein